MTPIDPQDPLLQWASAPHVAEVGCLGRHVQVRTNARAVMRWYAERFPGALPAAEVAVEVDVILEPSRWSDTWLTPAVAAESVHHMEADAAAEPAAQADVSPMTYRQRGDLFLAQTRLGTAVCHRAQGDVAVFLRTWPLDRGSRAALLEAPMWRALETTGMVPLHAAGLVSPAGRTVVLRGPAGAGKSTLAYAAIQRGWRLVAEEVVWWDAGAGVLRGDPWHINLEADTGELFPVLRSESSGVVREVQGVRIRVPPQATAEAAPPGPVVFLGHRTRDEPELEALDSGEVKARLDAGAVAGERTLAASDRQAAFGALLVHGALLLRAGRPDPTLEQLERWLDRHPLVDPEPPAEKPQHAPRVDRDRPSPGDP